MSALAFLVLSLIWSTAHSFGGDQLTPSSKNGPCTWLMTISGTLVATSGKHLLLHDISNTHFWSDRPCHKVRRALPSGIVSAINAMSNSTGGAPNAVAISNNISSFIEIGGAELFRIANISKPYVALHNVKNIAENNHSLHRLRACTGCRFTIVVDNLTLDIAVAGIIALIAAIFLLCFTAFAPECPAALIGFFSATVGDTAVVEGVIDEASQEVAWDAARFDAEWSEMEESLEEVDDEYIDKAWEDLENNYNLDAITEAAEGEVDKVFDSIGTWVDSLF